MELPIIWKALVQALYRQMPSLALLFVIKESFANQFELDV